MEDNSIVNFKNTTASIFKEVSVIKLNIRLNLFSENEIIHQSENLADSIDVLYDKLMDFNEEYCDFHARWFSDYFDKELVCKSHLLFLEEELYEDSNFIKGYFNYCVDWIVEINHLLMCLEFKELHKNCFF